MQPITYLDIQNKYKEIKPTMDVIYNSFGYLNKKPLVESVLEENFDEEKFRELLRVFDSMWLYLPDGIFNIFTPLGRDFLGFTETLSEFEFYRIKEEKKNENN